MRAVLTNFGTLGDVQPFLALAVELKRNGHQPVLAAAPAYRAFAELHGIEFTPVGPDMRQQQSGITQAMMDVPDVVQSEAGMLALFQPLAEALPRMLEDLRAACRGADVLISGRVQPAARMVHDLTGIPFVTILVEHSGSGGGSPAFQAAVRGLVNPLRGTLGLPPLDNPLVDGHSPQLVLTGLSRHVRPAAEIEPPHHHTVGYLFLDEPDFAPDADLAAFLDAGEPPVCITFGSMTHDDPAALTDTLVQAAAASGRRALIQHGWSGLGQRVLPPTVRALGHVPHGWLLPRVSCLVHHGGAGTTGAAFRAGVPQVVVPHTYDQFTWAEIVRERGCGGPGIPIGGLTAGRLSGALDTVLTGTQYRDAAATLGAQIRSERGTSKARHLVEDLVRKVGLSTAWRGSASPAATGSGGSKAQQHQRNKSGGREKKHMAGQTSQTETTGLEIAIVGMAGRFPGARDLDAFWRNLRDGVESITFLKDADMEPGALDSPGLRSDPRYVKAAAILEDAELFDAGYFGITPKEAEVMDPQQRVFLECAVEALENAGYDSERFRGRIGVYAGARTDTYVFNLFSNAGALGGLDPFELGLGNDLAFLTTRVAHRLNLRGPAYSVHTACSTSLVAVHLASQALLADECRLAIAGGVAINVPQRVGYLHQYGGIMSPDGHCRAFDAKAAGTIFGSGIGLVVLKRLEDALEDGDTIHAVIKGSAINNDGSVKASFTAPSVQGQATVIKDAIAAADVAPESISYVETHGTGTALGDPIEIRALTKAFGSKTRGRRTVPIGSVKTNVGHLDAAAGSASLLKAVLALKHQQLPPSLHFESPNPQIDFDSGPFYVNTALQPWAREKTPRRAGVSAFGIGGTNAHFILEEAPATAPSTPGRPWELLLVSARSHTALDTATARLAQHLENHPDASLADVAYTLQVGRKAHAFRRLVVAKDTRDAARVLRMSEPQRVLTGTYETGNRPVSFLFSDAGAGASLESLYRAEPAYRAEVDRCAEWVQKRLGENLVAALHPEDGSPPRRSGPLATVARFVEPYALARLWMAWGVRPESLLGEGLGELVAACLAGVLPLEDALALAAARGGGAAPSLNGAALKPPEVALFSTSTGALLTEAEATRPATWLDASRPSRVTEALRELVKEPTRVLLAIGAPGTLLESARAAVGATGTRAVLASLPATGDTTPVPAAVLTTLGRLWLEGVEVDWEGLYEGQSRRRVPLPTYPFERQRYWIGPAERTVSADLPQGKLVDVADWFHVPSWRRTAPLALDRKALAERRCWLVFVDGLGVGEALCRSLEDAGQDVVRVLQGGSFMRDAARRYAIDPKAPADYTNLWKDLADQELLPTSVVHLWSLTPQGDGATSPEQFRRLQDTGYYSLLHLGQAFAKGDTSRPVRLEVVTNRLQNLEGEHLALPEKATLLGPCKVIPQEQQHVSTRCIDLIAPEPLTAGVAQTASRLLAELSQKSKDALVAWRGQHRFAQVFSPLRLEATEAAPYPLREKGVYLLTGGLGGVGLLLADHLAEKFQARLVLLGRSPLPPSTEWDAYLASHPAEDKVARQLLRLKELEKRGAEVLVVRADVSDSAQLEAAVAQAEARFGALHGVLHCAGITHGSSLYNPLTDIGRAESETQFGPKVYGTYALEKALRGRAVDFVLLFSSNAAVLGGLGYLTYAASNLFMDAFANARAGQPGTRWVSASWDPWPEETKHTQVRTSMDQYAMTAAESADAVTRLATLGVDGQVVVATGDLPQRWKLWIQRDTSQQTSGARAAAGRGRQAKTAFVPPSTDVEKQLAAIWQEILGVEQVGLNDNFFDLGGHSLLATRVAGRLRTQFDLEVPLAKLFEAATVSALAKLVADHQAALDEAASQAALDELANLSDEEIEAELARRSR